MSFSERFCFYIWVTATITLSSFFIGYQLAAFGVTLYRLKYSELSTIEFYTIYSGLLAFGGLIGTVVAYFMIDRYGRLLWLIIADIVGIIGWIMSWFENYTVFAFGRFFCGIAAGMFSISAPVFVREIIPMDLVKKFISWH
jgi:MFS family permease